MKAAAGKFRRKLRIDDLFLYLEWGEPDPADAAIHYGQAWGAAEAIAAFLEANFTVKHREISLDLNYQLDKPRLTLRAALSLTVAQLLAIALPLGWAAVKPFGSEGNKRIPRRCAPSREGKGSPTMERNHPVSELMAETIQQIRNAVDANTVVGEPIVAGEVTLIPVSRISLGFGTGGSEMGGKAPKALGENPFGGGGGAGLKVIPVCFLVVSGGMVKVLPVDAAPETSLDRVVDLIPDLVNKLTSYLEERKAKKEAEGTPGV